MSDPLHDLDTGLSRMGDGIRRAHAAFDDADAGFLQALEALRAITEARAAVGGTLLDLRESVTTLQALVLEQGETLTAQREQLTALRAELRELRERNGGQP